MADDSTEGLGARVRQARDALGLSQHELGSAAGTTNMTIYKIEKGIHEPKARSLLAIARALRVSADWLLTGRVASDGAEEAVLHPSFHEFLETPQAKKALPEHIDELRRRTFPGTPTVFTWLIELQALQSLEDEESTEAPPSSGTRHRSVKRDASAPESSQARGGRHKAVRRRPAK